jgi:4-hydroxy-tetrahydrodipicolinate synthase
MTKLIDSSARGVFPISITPFLESGALDLEGMDRLTDFYLSCGVPGLTLLGVLGEASKLSHEESMTIIERAIRRIDGAMQVIVGTSHLGFDNLRAYTDAAMSAGASGVMVAPATNLKTEEQVLGYFEGLVGKIGTDVPLAFQDFPQNTGVFVSAETINRLLKRHPSIKIVKHEEAAAMRKIGKLRSQEAAGERERVSILVGNSGIHLPQELHRGVDGANTGVAFPEMLVEVCNRFFAGDAESAEDLYDIFLPIVRHEQPLGFGLAVRKEIFRRRGLIQCARLRAPGPGLDADDQAELSRLLNRLVRRLQAAGEDSVIKTYAVSTTA